MTSADRVEATLRLLLAAVREAGVPMSGDRRVSEENAAALVGVAAGTLKNLRTEGTGPAAYRTPVGGSRWSYRLDDLAAWLEARRESW